MPPSLDACQQAGKARGPYRGSPRLLACLAACLAAVCWADAAAAEKVRISELSDIDFGLIPNLQSDARRSQNICVYSQSTGGRYTVMATGSGAGSAFALSNGSSSLPYEVEWSDQSGQTGGTSLAPNVPAPGRVSAATQQTCRSGPPTSASLTVVLRSSSLSQAREGTYSGSLTLLVAAE